MSLTKLSEKSERILELETRKKIYEIIKNNAGCHFREIERRSSIPHSTLRYHLNFLAKNDLIKEKREKNNLRYFPKEFKKENIEILALLRQRSARVILIYLLEQDRTHSEITDFARLSPSTISWHLNKLAKGGIIQRINSGKRTRYSISLDKQLIIKLLISYKESFLDKLVDKTVEMWEIG